MNELALLKLKMSLRVDIASITCEVNPVKCLIIFHLGTYYAATLLTEIIIAHVEVD